METRERIFLCKGYIANKIIKFITENIVSNIIVK